jgi:hypothetical protein
MRVWRIRIGGVVWADPSVMGTVCNRLAADVQKVLDASQVNNDPPLGVVGVEEMNVTKIEWGLDTVLDENRAMVQITVEVGYTHYLKE